MANYSVLKAAIQAVIKANGNNEITGALLQQSLISMIMSLGAHYEFVDVATPSTNPGTPDQNVFYFAATAGTYSNFGGIVVNDGEACFLCYNGTWTKKVSGAATAAQVTALIQDVSENTQDIADIRQAVNDIHPIVIVGDVTNAPDEEDITTDGNDLLKFADRTTLNGMGYKILRRNKTFSEQVTDVDTIYEIRYDFNLGGASVIIPNNCILKFVGGKLSNGGLSGGGYAVEGGDYQIFDNIQLWQNLRNISVKAIWFGISPDNADNSALFDAMCNYSLYNCLGGQLRSVTFGKGEYVFSTTIHPVGLELIGAENIHPMRYGYNVFQTDLGYNFTIFRYAPTNYGTAITIGEDFDDNDAETAQAILDSEVESVFVGATPAQYESAELRGTRGVIMRDIKLVCDNYDPANNTIAIVGQTLLVVERCTFDGFNVCVLKLPTQYSRISGCIATGCGAFVKWSTKGGDIDTTTYMENCSITTVDTVLKILPYSKYLTSTRTKPYDVRVKNFVVQGCGRFLEAWDNMLTIFVAEGTYYEANRNVSNNEYLNTIKFSKNYRVSSSFDGQAPSYTFRDDVVIGAYFLDADNGNISIFGGSYGIGGQAGGSFKINDAHNVNALKVAFYSVQYITGRDFFTSDSFVTNAENTKRRMLFIANNSRPSLDGPTDNVGGVVAREYRVGSYGEPANRIRRYGTAVLFQDADYNIAFKMVDGKRSIGISGATPAIDDAAVFPMIAYEDSQTYNSDNTNIGVRAVNSGYMQFVGTGANKSGIIARLLGGSFSGLNHPDLPWSRKDFLNYSGGVVMTRINSLAADTAEGGKSMLPLMAIKGKVKTFDVYDVDACHIGASRPLQFLPKGFVHFNTQNGEFSIVTAGGNGGEYNLKITLTEGATATGTLAIVFNGVTYNYSIVAAHSVADVIDQILLNGLQNSEYVMYRYDATSITLMAKYYMAPPTISVTAPSGVSVNIGRWANPVNNTWQVITQAAI